MALVPAAEGDLVTHASHVDELRKAVQASVADEHDRTVDLMQAVLDHATYENRFTVFGLLLVQVPAIGWLEAIRRAKASTV